VAVFTGSSLPGNRVIRCNQWRTSAEAVVSEQSDRPYLAHQCVHSLAHPPQFLEPQFRVNVIGLVCDCAIFQVFSLTPAFCQSYRIAIMSPLRAMTGDTLMGEKTPQSPTSPTDTDATLSGDAIIDIAEDDCTTRPSSQHTRSSAQSAQPRT
jgi:hypothetical protein